MAWRLPAEGCGRQACVWLAMALRPVQLAMPEGGGILGVVLLRKGRVALRLRLAVLLLLLLQQLLLHLVVLQRLHRLLRQQGRAIGPAGRQAAAAAIGHWRPIVARARSVWRRCVLMATQVLGNGRPQLPLLLLLLLLMCRWQWWRHGSPLLRLLPLPLLLLLLPLVGWRRAGSTHLGVPAAAPPAPAASKRRPPRAAAPAALACVPQVAALPAAVPAVRLLAVPCCGTIVVAPARRACAPAFTPIPAPAPAVPPLEIPAAAAVTPPPLILLAAAAGPLVPMPGRVILAELPPTLFPTTAALVPVLMAVPAAAAVVPLPAISALAARPTAVPPRLLLPLGAELRRRLLPPALAAWIGGGCWWRCHSCRRLRLLRLLLQRL